MHSYRLRSMSDACDDEISSIVCPSEHSGPPPALGSLGDPEEWSTPDGSPDEPPAPAPAAARPRGPYGTAWIS